MLPSNFNETLMIFRGSLETGSLVNLIHNDVISHRSFNDRIVSSLDGLNFNADESILFQLAEREPSELITG